MVTSIQFLLDGRVTMAGAHDIEAPAAIGFEELLVGSPIPAAIIAADRAITLSLTADEFLALLSENVELAEGIFRMLIESRGLAAGRTLMHGTLPPDVKDSAHLRPIDNLLLLESSPLLTHATAPQLWRLAAIAHERTIAVNAEALAKGSEAAILVVLSGALRVDEKSQQGTATAGDLIGLYETLAGTTLENAVTAIKEARVLRIDRGALFELLADHTDLLQGLFSMLLRTSSGRTISNTVSTP
jgi:CRP-like cAMP-binding protein